MNEEEIGSLVKKSYGIEALNIERIKGVFKIDAAQGSYSLKVIKYEFGHFFFILKSIEHLLNNGYDNVPKIIATKNDEKYVCFDEKFAFLSPWIDGRTLNYDNPLDVKTAAENLAKLHDKSEGFFLDPCMKPRIGWFKWPENFKGRINEMNDFKRIIEEKSSKTDFDREYISVLQEEINKAERSIEDLGDSEYICKMQKEIGKRCFCHHDYAHHNILICGDKVYVIDFDYCMLDTHLHDLASLLIRKMKNGKWDMKDALCILDSYSSIKEVVRSDLPVMAAFIEFPQAFWQLGIQYYYEKQPWGEDFFNGKLEKIIEDRDDRQEFVEEFQNYSYGGSENG